MTSRITGLHGANGSGKSTLVHLLTRRYSLGSGQIRIDGLAATEIELQSYRKQVAVIPETVKIFNATLGDNLLLGQSDLGLDVLVHRMEQLAVGPFIARFRAGLATMLGEDGRQLSAGERQMIGLIRVLLATPSVLIVDEGLNSLDPRLLALAAELLRAHAARGAVLLVSHDAAVLALANDRFVLDKGSIAREASDLPSSHSRPAAMEIS